MTSDHDTRQVRQQYELRPLIRSDGKRHPKYQSDLAKKKVPTTEIDGKAYDLMGAGTLAFSSDIEGISRQGRFQDC